MSPLWLTFILQAALATESKVSVSGEVAELEAAVLAKFAGETPSVPVTAQTSDATSPANPTSPATGAIGVPSEVAQLEAAVLAKRYGEKATTAETRQTSGLNIRKLDETVEPATVKEAEPTTVPLEEPMQAKGDTSWGQLGSSLLSREGFEELMQEGAGCTEKEQCAAVHEAEEPAPAVEAEGSARSKMRLKSSSSPVLAMDVPLTAEAEPAKEEAAAAPAKASPAPAARRKAVVMQDMPHYKNHGAHMVHVEAPERKSTSTQGLKQASEPSDAEKAESLVQKRAEVEEFFHLAQNGVERIHAKEVEPKKPTSAVWGFFRTIFLFGLLGGMAVLAYHKFDVIARMSNSRAGGGSLKSFKQKREDDFSAGDFYQQPQQMMSGYGRSSCGGCDEFGV